MKQNNMAYIVLPENLKIQPLFIDLLRCDMFNLSIVNRVICWFHFTCKSKTYNSVIHTRKHVKCY